MGAYEGRRSQDQAAAARVGQREEERQRRIDAIRRPRGLNRVRRLAYSTARNIDGASSHRRRREDDRWFLDPRLSVGDQTGAPVYAENDLDRGHLVRRLDPAWGDSDALAKLAKLANHVEQLTGLSFGALQDFDPLGALEGAVTAAREVRSEGDLVL